MTVETMGDKFKRLEREMRSVLPTRRIIGLRLDGKSFHTFTKQFQRPYDERFMYAMTRTSEELLNNHLTGGLFSYVQSDEITVFFTDKWTERTQYFFGGKVEKILSTSASFATGAFLKNSANVEGIPVFDARFFILDSIDEVQEYMDWRRLDARKNAISMAAYSLHSDKALRNVSTKGRAELLRGTDFEVLPETFFNGRISYRVSSEEKVEFWNKKSEQMEQVITERSRIVSAAATRELTESVVNSFRWLDEIE